MKNHLVDVFSFEKGDFISFVPSTTRTNGALRDVDDDCYYIVDVFHRTAEEVSIVFLNVDGKQLTGNYQRDHIYNYRRAHIRARE